MEEIVTRRGHLNFDLENHVNGDASDQKWRPLQWGQVWLGKKGEVETPWFRKVTGCLWTRWPKKGNYDQTKAIENFLLRAPCFFYNSCRNNPICFCPRSSELHLAHASQKWLKVGMIFFAAWGQHSTLSQKSTALPPPTPGSRERGKLGG